MGLHKPAIALLLLMLGAHIGAAHAGLLYTETGEDGTMNASKVHITCGTTCGTLTAVPSPVRVGSKAFRFELKTSDGPGKGTSFHRVQARPLAPTHHGEKWYALSVFVPSDWEPDPAWELFVQWHTYWEMQPGNVDGDHPGGTDPPLSIVLIGPQWRLYSENKANPGFLWSGNVEKNKWTDWVAHVKWSDKTDGFFQLWKDGQLVFDRKNMVTSWSNEALMMFGVYKWSWSPGSPGYGHSTVSKRVYYFDEIRIGDANSSYAEVAPGGGGRPPDKTPPAAPTNASATVAATP